MASTPTPRPSRRAATSWSRIPISCSRFVEASIVGWYTYLYGDASKGNAAIKAANPDITDELIAFSTDSMKRFGIVDSGDALTLGHRRDDRTRASRASTPAW